MLPTTKQLQHFIAIAETGQISKAALRCHVSQSSMTASLKVLEQTVGVALFSRHQGGVRLTESGVRFLRYAQKAETTLRQAVAALNERPSAVEGPVRLGVTETISAYVIAPLLGDLNRQFPLLELTVVEMERDQLEQALNDNALDLAILLASNLSPGTLQCQALVRSPRQLWGHPDHPLMNADRVTLADVARERYILLDMDEHITTVERYWAGFGLQMNAHYRTASIEAVRSLVGSGEGIAILSDLIYRPWSLDGQRILRRPLADSVPSMDVGLAWAHARPQGASFFELKAFLQRWFKST